jgi:hypothetical protein
VGSPQAMKPGTMKPSLRSPNRSGAPVVAGDLAAGGGPPLRGRLRRPIPRLDRGGD